MVSSQRKAEALDSLRTIPLFSSVSDEDLESIASLLIDRRFPKHKTIVEEGLPGDYMYVIREGRVKVTKLSGDGHRWGRSWVVQPVRQLPKQRRLQRLP